MFVWYVVVTAIAVAVTFFSSSLLFLLLLLGFFVASLFSVINGCLLFRCIMPLKLKMVLCCEYSVIISGNCCCVNGYYCFAQNMNCFCFVKLLLFFFSFAQIIFWFRQLIYLVSRRLCGCHYLFFSIECAGAKSE